MLGLLCDEDNPTPLVRLHRVSPYRHTTVYAKLEWYNPFGAVKDRVAANMIRDAEERGRLGAGSRTKLVEATSGNTGMGLVMLGNAKGYSLTTPLSDAIPLEKRDVMRFFGCDVIELDDSLCPAPGAPEGAIAKAAEIGAQPEFTQLNQYENAANPDAHYRTTGPEIWKQTGGRVTHFVAGLGTCGTITGTGRYLKERNPAVQVMGVHPAEGHDIPGVRSRRQLSQTAFYHPDEYDQQVEIDNERAFELCLRLNREESIVAGPSSGMALAGAFEMIPDVEGGLVVVVFPDSVFKYTSSMRRHLPKLFPAAAPKSDAGPDPGLTALLEAARKSPDVIDVGALEDMIDSEPALVLVDVRTRPEFAEEHIEDSVSLPLADLAPGAAGLPEDLGAPIVTVCNIGRISLNAMLMLKAMGYRRVHNLMGGLDAWVSEGHPLDAG
jgi:cysteine synthase/rhodanese-related sulfurtransferase